jgi:hypothetical protein
MKVGTSLKALGFKRNLGVRALEVIAKGSEP